MDDVDALLPLPSGDPQLLLNLGKNLAYVASHGTGTVLGATEQAAWAWAAPGPVRRSPPPAPRHKAGPGSPTRYATESGPSSPR